MSELLECLVVKLHNSDLVKAFLSLKKSCPVLIVIPTISTLN